ncbi:MAG: LytTR family DNA-binding domain-containing protein [Oscillospiraceae bacterium]
MKIDLKIDPACTQPHIVVVAKAITPEVTEILQKLSELQAPQVLAGFKEEMVELLVPESIVRIYAEGQKVYVQTEAELYQIKMRLYEAEEKLDAAVFVRISNSEIINLKMVLNMDISLSGTICIRLKGGVSTYASRRFVPKIKKMLGI